MMLAAIISDYRYVGSPQHVPYVLWMHRVQSTIAHVEHLIGHPNGWYV